MQTRFSRASAVFGSHAAFVHAHVGITNKPATHAAKILAVQSRLQTGRCSVAQPQGVVVELDHLGDIVSILCTFSVGHAVEEDPGALGVLTTLDETDVMTGLDADDSTEIHVMPWDRIVLADAFNSLEVAQCVL